MLNSVHVDIAMGFRQFSSALEMWLHLRNIYQQKIEHKSLKWNTTLPNIHRGTTLFVPFKLACSCSGLNRIKFLGEICLRQGSRKCWENDKGQEWYSSWWNSYLNSSRFMAVCWTEKSHLLLMLCWQPSCVNRPGLELKLPWNLCHYPLLHYLHKNQLSILHQEMLR